MTHQGRSLDERSIPAAGLDRASAMALIAAAGDIAVVVDAEGIVRDVATSEAADAGGDESSRWVDLRWVDTVTPESRGKVEALIREVATTGASRRRQVNHPTSTGADRPVAYTAVRLGDDGSLVAVGRDMRAIASLQQRLVETQQALERDYWRLRHVETRYRLLFQVSSEAILVVDSGTRRIVDANDAAARMFDLPADRLVGRDFPVGIDAAAAPRLEEALVSARATGNSGTVETLLAGSGQVVDVSVSCFRQEAVSLFLVRFTSRGGEVPQDATLRGDTAELLSRSPDAVVITDADGRVLSANRAFLDLVQLAGEQQSHGRLISEWIGRPGADLRVFLTMLRKHGVVRLLATAVRGEQGATTEAEVSAVLSEGGKAPIVGFIMRDVGRRVAHGPQGARDLTLAVEQLTTLVGRVAMRDLLRDTTDLVERHFIEAALELTQDNRTAAAEVLGVSRQSLYVKMRRHRLTDGDLQGRQAG